MIVPVCTGRSSTAWSSIEWLIGLAYIFATQIKVFEDCSSGKDNSATLTKQMRVNTRELEHGYVQTELAVCGSEFGAGDIIARSSYS
jgi:hypothetical protein